MVAVHCVGTSPPHRTAWARRVVVAVLLVAISIGVSVSAVADPAVPPAPQPPPVVATPQPAPQSPPPNPAPGPLGAPVPGSPGISPSAPTPDVPANPAVPPGGGPQVPVMPGAPATPVPHNPQPGTPNSGSPQPSGDTDCGFTDVSCWVDTGINGFFRHVVESGLNPLLGLLSHTLLTTPDPSDLPRVGQLWGSSWQLMVAMYGLLVMAAGVLLMVRETLQTRWSLQDLLPRIVVGFIAGAMSMFGSIQIIRFANALAEALAGQGLDPNSATAALTQLATTSDQSRTFLVLLQVALVVMLLMLLITYVVRVAITIILVVAAPLALMCHALPGVDSVARWWWRSFVACLGVQVVQSLVLITSLRVFLTPGGWEFFGPNTNGIVGLIIGLALMGVLIKVPFWLLSTMRIGHGRNMVSSLVRSYVTYKTFGLIKGGEKAAAAAIQRPTTPRPNTPVRATTGTSSRPSGGSSDPYARVRLTRDGQLMLPLEGVHRVRRNPSPAPQSATGTPTQTTTAAARQRRSPQGRQLAFDFRPPDPYRRVRADRHGQYLLPIQVKRVRRAPGPANPAPAAAPVGPPASPVFRPVSGTQVVTDIETSDPYETNRPSPNSQYSSPFRVNRIRPAQQANPSPRTVPSARSSRRSTGRQLHLPLPDLPVRRRLPRGGNPQ